ncbi:cadmium resistance transporter [Dellaglioa algida]|uniref:Cadmium transporter n=1 Tax=Dellaglioa algida TaxID=105612 RepID=A0A5C6MCK5_9LACO|nr:cadmium resistance transporter [Dellaglioa algida]MDK1716196.1 CadD family cadmium resistance transporter [Dellaglioa algida]MDK1719477.1 CadD family cadmium resistance transporter [Dellaglioa algida]MDK1721021.1 CadD family cadmium resistance transporter [Dellaglioa algida]MDK1722820.1 CadD family cadmium resistance transporter [Dellaglioa algida]MDK1724439.1 CadD family cadmium resistance transporter [Dellaglioa algida]
MTALIGSTVLAFISTNIDYLLILIIIFAKYKNKHDDKLIFIGELLGSGTLIVVSLIVAFWLKMIPEEWILGFLGIIPIVMGIKMYFGDEDEGNEVREKLGKPQRSIILSVIMITIATCGPDNLAIYVPFFTTLNAGDIPIVLGLFFIFLCMITWLSKMITNLPKIQVFFERFGDLITLLVYVFLGIYILLESGTIQHFI